MYEWNELDKGLEHWSFVGPALFDPALREPSVAGHGARELVAATIATALEALGAVVLEADAAEPWAWVDSLWVLAKLGEFRSFVLPFQDPDDGALRVLIARGTAPGTSPMVDADDLAFEVGFDAVPFWQIVDPLVLDEDFAFGLLEAVGVITE